MEVEVSPHSPQKQQGQSSMTELKKMLVPALISAVIAFVTTLLGYSKVDARLSESQLQVQDANQRANAATAQVGQLATTSVGSLQQGQKLCRVLQGKTWRDGLIVPRNWSVSLCVDYMKKTGGNGYQLGCIYEDGTNLGKEDGSFPSPNCGCSSSESRPTSAVERTITANCAVPARSPSSRWASGK